MKLFVTGGKGMLGRTLRRVLTDVEFVVGDLPECDITKAEAVREAIAAADVDAVVHCAAMTQVDLCETERERAFLINETGSENVAKVCEVLGKRLIAISTDYVFRGDKPCAYVETDEPDPQTVYGASKLAGENAIRQNCANHLILRLAWLYGDGGPSFLHTMLKLADGTRPVLKVVNDQRGNPTSAVVVARHLRMILERKDLRGIMHLTCEGETTWYDYAKEIFRVAGVKQDVVPCTTAEFPRPAHRPANSSLEKAALAQSGLPPMPHWKDALREYMAEILCSGSTGSSGSSGD